MTTSHVLLGPHPGPSGFLWSLLPCLSASMLTPTASFPSSSHSDLKTQISSHHRPARDSAMNPLNIKNKIQTLSWPLGPEWSFLHWFLTPCFLPLFPHWLCFSWPLHCPWAYYSCFYLGAFAPAAPCDWSILLKIIAMFIPSLFSGLCSNITFSKRPSLTTFFLIQLPHL